MVGEMLPDERNRVTLADEKDQYGLRVSRIIYSWSDNDKALIGHALDQMQISLEAVGARNVFRQENDTNHLAGTARMGADPSASVVNTDCRSWDIPEPVDLRWLHLPDNGRRQPVTHNHEHRDAHGRSHPCAGKTRRTVMPKKLRVRDH